MPNSSEKDGPALVPILHIPISSTHSPSPSLSYKSTFFPPTSEPKKPIVEIGERNNVDSDIEMQLPSPQQSLQPSLQTLQESSKLRRSKYQT